MIKVFTYLFIFLPAIFTTQSFQWVSFEMTQRNNNKGVTTEARSVVYFAQNSDLVIRQVFPFELFILNNKDGELKIYNPERNEVYQSMNYQLGSQTNQFYFFLMNKTDDMGLTDMGFALASSRLEDQLLISVYDAPENAKQYLEKVEVVHKGKQPIFIGYLDKKDKYLKKVFYYNYMEDLGVTFPGVITEINYLEKKDSIITKTSFTNFKIDDLEAQGMLEFQVPDHARLIE